MLNCVIFVVFFLVSTVAQSILVYSKILSSLKELQSWESLQVAISKEPICVVV